jgi:hypothetical protein
VKLRIDFDVAASFFSGGHMVTFLIAGLAAGLIFVLMDFVLNVNPLAMRLSEPFRPIARTRMPLAGAVIIDLLCGLAMAGIFLLLRPALPGGCILGVGISFGLVAWFFRVLMSALSQWVMFNVPRTTLLYSILAGLLEMVALGVFYALALSSFP